MTPLDGLVSCIRLVDETMADLESIEVNDGNSDLFIVTTSMMNTMTGYAKVIFAAIQAKLDGAVGPLERALYELWIEYNYLLNSDRHRNAVKAQVNAALEVGAFLDKNGDSATTDKIIQHHRERDRTIVDEVLAQRKSRRYHWSGKSRSALEREVAPGFPMYQVLSWEAHATLASVLDVKTFRRERDAQFIFGRDIDPVASARRAKMTCVLLYRAVEAYVNLWSLRAIPPMETIMPLAVLQDSSPS